MRWIVLQDILVIRRYAVERLHELIADFPGYDGYENNNRPTQPLNDREIEGSQLAVDRSFPDSTARI